MNTSKRMKSLVSILILIILFPSCSVYKPTSLNLRDVTNQDSKILIKTKDGRSLKFKTLLQRDTLFYGVKNRKPITIFEKDIKAINLRDRKASTVKTIIVSTFGIGIIFLLVYMGLGGQELL